MRRGLKSTEELVFQVKVTCKCGHEKASMACFEIDRLASQRFMSKAAKADAKNEVNLEELTRQDSMERYKWYVGW